MAVHWDLQRTSDTKAEDGEENKLVNYSNRVLATNIWVNQDSRVDYVRQRALEGFVHPWTSEINSISWSTLHIADPGMALGGHSPSVGTEAAGGWMQPLPLVPLHPWLKEE